MQKYVSLLGFVVANVRLCVLLKPVSNPTVKQLASWLKEADKATGLFAGSITGLVFMAGRGAAKSGSSAEDGFKCVCGDEQIASTCASLHTDGDHSHIESHDLVR